MPHGEKFVVLADLHLKSGQVALEILIIFVFFFDNKALFHQAAPTYQGAVQIYTGDQEGDLFRVRMQARRLTATAFHRHSIDASTGVAREVLGRLGEGWRYGMDRKLVPGKNNTILRSTVGI